MVYSAEGTINIKINSNNHIHMRVNKIHRLGRMIRHLGGHINSI